MLQGYKKRDAFIVTQMPLPHTVVDFWTMIHDHSCRTVIMMNSLYSGTDDRQVTYLHDEYYSYYCYCYYYYDYYYYYTVSQKIPTFKLSVTLSNLNRFSKFLHHWKACKFATKPIQNYLPHIGHVATLPWQI